MFPKIGVVKPPKSSILRGFSIINHPFWGFSPYFWKYPNHKSTPNTWSSCRTLSWSSWFSCSSQRKAKSWTGNEESGFKIPNRFSRKNGCRFYMCQGPNFPFCGINSSHRPSMGNPYFMGLKKTLRNCGWWVYPLNNGSWSTLRPTHRVRLSQTSRVVLISTSVRPSATPQKLKAIRGFTFSKSPILGATKTGWL